MKRPFNYEPAIDELEVLLGRNIILEWKIMNPGQFRISEKLDVYPKSKKYFYIPEQEWGTYENLEDLIYMLKK